MPRRAETTWNLLNVAMTHFLAHIERKPDRYALSIVDLLHVSNFKGGNASITEDEPPLSNKLNVFSEALRQIAKVFGNRALRDLTAVELANLTCLADDLLALTKQEETKIRGFGASYASALLTAHFPKLLPILDRRVLNGARIKVKLNSQGQVKNIERYYRNLIERFHAELARNHNLSIRDLDRRWFCVKLPLRRTRNR